MSNYPIMSGPGLAALALIFLVMPIILISVGAKGVARTAPGTPRRVAYRIAFFAGLALLLFIPLVLVYNFVILRWLHNL